MKNRNRICIAILLAAILCVLITGCSDSPNESKSNQETFDKAKQIIAKADGAEAFVTRYTVADESITVSVPVSLPSPYDDRNESTAELLHEIDLSGFTELDGEPGHIISSFLVTSSEGDCILTYGCTESDEEYADLMQQMKTPEDMTICFTMTDTGDSVTVVGDWQENVSTVDSNTDTATALSAWQMYCTQNNEPTEEWCRVSGYAYKVAVITSYFEDGTVEGPAEHRSLNSSALIASVIDSLEKYTKPVEEPSDFNANREVEILGEDYGTVTFDLSDETVCIGDKYYSLTEISHDALVMLHRALYDNFYGVEG